MRVSVTSPTLTTGAVADFCKRLGCSDLTVAPRSGVVFCDASASAVASLEQAGCKVRQSGSVHPHQVIPVYAGIQVLVASTIWALRSSFTPPLTGSGTTIAILDSGIRADHVALQGKVIQAENFTESPTTEDRYDHGSAVAFAAAGGHHGNGMESGAAPGALLWNMKVLRDPDGLGLDEWAVLAIERVIELREKALAAGAPETDPSVPNVLNASWGEADDGDPENPLRVAARAAIAAGISVIAAAGNQGPQSGTIEIPAVEPGVAAVGAMTLDPLQVWERSARGPTREGYTKPDMVFFGVNVLVASSKSATAFELKSGTSFAAPYVSGLVALGRELIFRTYGAAPEQLGLGAEEVVEFLLQFTVKPSGDPWALQGQKDNQYGYGIPYGALVRAR